MRNEVTKKQTTPVVYDTLTQIMSRLVDEKKEFKIETFLCPGIKLLSSKNSGKF